MLEGFSLGEFAQLFFEPTGIVSSARSHINELCNLIRCCTKSFLLLALNSWFQLRYLVPVLEQTWVFSTCINVLQPMILQIYFRHQWLRKLFLTDPVILPHVLSSSLTSLCGEGGTRLHIVIKKQELWIYIVVLVCFVLCSLFSSQSYLTVYCLFGSYWALKWYSCRTIIAPWSLSSTVIVSSATATMYIKLGYYFFSHAYDFSFIYIAFGSAIIS